MRVTTSVRDNFNAAHTVEGDPVCVRTHWHNWEVEVTVEGKIKGNTGVAVDTLVLLSNVNAVIDEIRGKDLNESIPGVSPTSEQLAIYLHERLILAFPNITAIQINMGSVKTSRVEWELR